MSDLIAGTCYFNVDGKRWALVGEFRYRPSGVMREAKLGSDGYHGHKEKPMQGQIVAKLRNTGAELLSSINNIVNGTITAELANGKTVVGRNMFRAGDPVTADAEEAEFECTFEGPEVIELV